MISEYVVNISEYVKDQSDEVVIGKIFEQFSKE